MIRSSRQLKDWIRNLSKEIGIESHVLIRKYMMERFLERVSKSQYKDCFILKGGMLISAFLGAEARATTNTRMRDLYDIHLLLESQKIDYDTLAFALERTAKKRGSFNPKC